jgi:hypothetical protein
VPDSMDAAARAQAFYDAMPHPNAPSIKAGDYATMVRLATITKFGGHASPQETEAFAKEFAATGMSPQQYEHALEHMSRVSFALHGRPPSMQEIAQHKDKSPADIKKYYSDLPDQHYPAVSAGDMAKYLAIADPHASEHIGRRPVKGEAAYFAQAGMNASAVKEHYATIQREKENRQNGNQNNAAGQPGEFGTPASGQRQPDPGTSNPGMVTG